MGAIILSLEDEIPVIPGQETRRTIQICNSGSVVDRFEFDIVGPAKDWITVEPREINVYPDQLVGVEIVLAPPRSAKLPAGDVSFGLRVKSHEDDEGSTVEEMTVTVGQFVDFGVKLLPATKRARLGTRFNFSVENSGNAPLRVQLYAIDADAKLRFALSYHEIEVSHGKGAVVPVKVRPAVRMWRGGDAMLPFQILAVSQRDQGKEEHTADGVLVQTALVSDAVAKLVMAVSAAALSLFALWYVLLKPSVESEARRQAVLPTDPGANTSGGGSVSESGVGTGGAGVASAGIGAFSQSPLPSLTVEAGDKSEKRGAGEDEAAQVHPPRDEAGAGGRRQGPGEVETVSGSPFDFRLQADAGVSTQIDTRVRYTVPQTATLYIRDVVFENVSGDSGIVRLQRGNEVRRELSLDSFRDYETHFEEPVKFGPGEDVVFAVRCDSPGKKTAGAATCTPAVYFSGKLVTGE